MSYERVKIGAKLSRGLRKGLGTNLFTDFLPDDSGHLVSVKLNDRVCYDYLLERSSHAFCMITSWKRRRRVSGKNRGM